MSTKGETSQKRVTGHRRGMSAADRARPWRSGFGVGLAVAAFSLSSACGQSAVRADAGSGGLSGAGGAGAATGTGGATGGRGSGGTGAGGMDQDGGSGGAPIGGGGTAGTQDAGTAGTGGAGCVDIVVKPEAFGDPPDAWGITPLNGSVWRTASGLHAAWKTSLAVRTDAGVVSHPWLFVATFDPTTGAIRKLRRYDILPDAATLSDSNIRAVSGSTSDVFAASLRSFDVANAQPRNQTLFLGRLDDETIRLQVDLGWKSDAEDVPDIGWDGEAFAVHAKVSSTNEIFVARVSPAGQLVLPPTKYGSTGSPGGTPLGHRMSTDPTSGMSYLLDVPGVGRFLSGHDRSGQAVPWAANRPMNILIPELNVIDETLARNGGVAVDSTGGVWTVWAREPEAGVPYACIAAHVNKSGQVDRSFGFSGAAAFRAPAVIAASSTKAWVAIPEGRQIVAYEFDGGTMSPPRTIVSNPYGTTGTGTLLYTDLTGAFDWQGERWLWFSEHRTGASLVLHVIKITSDCVYLPATRPAM
jgi:hypothetical protein